MSKGAFLRVAIVAAIIVGLLAIIPAPSDIEHTTAEAGVGSSGGGGTQSMLEWGFGRLGASAGAF